MTFLSPLGALLALLVVVPLAAYAVAARRAARGRLLLGLEAPHATRDVALVALVAVPLLLGVAATQPALRTHHEVRVRTDAEAFFVFDVSRSMLASSSPTASTRLDRARADALRLRAAIPDVPAGVATLTDHVLPHLFPTPDRAAFASTIEGAIGIERPPPEAIDPNATSFDVVPDLLTQGYFQPSTRTRLVVLLTDGESRAFDAQTVGGELRGARLLVVRIWKANERVYGPGGRIEEAYRPDPGSESIVRALAAAAGGRAFDAAQLAQAEATLRAQAGTGPTRKRGLAPRTTTLAPYVALVVLGPLALLLWRRNLR
jgi:hypothetical protein